MTAAEEQEVREWFAEKRRSFDNDAYDRRMEGYGPAFEMPIDRLDLARQRNIDIIREPEPTSDRLRTHDIPADKLPGWYGVDSKPQSVQPDRIITLPATDKVQGWSA